MNKDKKYKITKGITVLMKIDGEGVPTPISVSIKTKKWFINNSRYLGLSTINGINGRYWRIMIDKQERILSYSDNIFLIQKEEPESK